VQQCSSGLAQIGPLFDETSILSPYIAAIYHPRSKSNKSQPIVMFGIYQTHRL
jgi:hypothetical protein